MIAIIDMDQRIEFISTKDNTDPKTVFILRPLSGSEMLDMSQFMEGGELKLSGNYIFSLLQKSIVEIKNGPEFPIEKVIKALPPFVISELMTKITEINHMTGQDSKN